MSDKAKIKTIGVLTSGGDAPGMNAAVRAVVRTALSKGIKVLGIDQGYKGLITGRLIEFDDIRVCGIIQRGGTILRTARCPEFKEEAGMQKALETARRVGMEGLVVIGGDGSFRGARDLSNRGLNCIGIPGSIDNDIGCSEYSIGFDTAINTVKEMVDRLRDTTFSHDRCSVVEVMGRGAGYIALYSGIATGATSILVPEIEFDLQRDVIDRIYRAKKMGKSNFIIIVAEGVGSGDVGQIARDIERITGVESRPTILGHVQRGGSPTVLDRLYASRMGNRAVELLAQGIGNKLIAMKANNIVEYDINEGLAMKREFDYELYEAAKILNL